MIMVTKRCIQLPRMQAQPALAPRQTTCVRRLFARAAGSKKGGPTKVGPPRFVLLLDPFTFTCLAKLFVLFLKAAAYGIDDGTCGEDHACSSAVFALGSGG